MQIGVLKSTQWKFKNDRRFPILIDLGFEFRSNISLKRKDKGDGPNKSKEKGNW